jgi:multiple sugar transport system permease protein
MSALLSRRPVTTYDEAAARLKRRRLLMTWGVTILAVALASIWLMPLFYAGVTSLKTAQQATEPPILPTDVATYEYEGREYDVLEVPFDDGVRELALVKKGRESSEFVDPADPDAGLIAWEGRWRTLEPVRSLSFAWGNYPEAWEKIDFPRLLFWTVFYAATTLIGAVISSAFVAYGFSRFRFRGRGILFGVLMATIILPPAVTQVPSYAFFSYIGWTGTWLPLVVPQFFANAYNVFLLRQYFMTIPQEMEQAASVDGAGPFRTFIYVILPQAVPALTAVSLFHFFFAWNDFFGPLIYLSSARQLQPISVGLTLFNGVYDTEPQLIMAASFISLAIPLLIFFFAQRVFIQGIVITGVDK